MDVYSVWTIGDIFGTRAKIKSLNHVKASVSGEKWTAAIALETIIRENIN